jgi:hypothetical protein
MGRTACTEHQCLYKVALYLKKLTYQICNCRYLTTPTQKTRKNYLVHTYQIYTCLKRPKHSQFNGAKRFYCVTLYLTEKLSKLRSGDRQQCRPQNCPFQSSFTLRTVRFTQGMPQFPQFTCRHHDDFFSRQIRF